MICLWYLVILENRLGKKGDQNDPGVTGEKWFLIKFSLWFLFCLAGAHLAFSSIKSLTIDSQISFNVSNFSSINQFTLVGIIVTVILLLSVYFISRNFVRTA